jgi:EmrB/QacA subfamily drug resistance transporter
MKTAKFTSREYRLIAALALVFFASVLSLSMFDIAVPQIRAEFSLPADTTSWFVIIFTIPYILLMPFYGRLGDLLGRRRMLVTGALVFASGSLICFLSANVPLIIVGRVVQGLGAAAITPLCLSIITQQVANAKRGKAIGTWNSFGPIAGIAGPATAGLIIEIFGWRSVFLPSVVVILISLPLVYRLLPKDTGSGSAAGVLRSYDWPGFLLFSISLSSLVLYVSSRAVSGKEPLTDWRFLIPTCAAAVLFILRERTASRPFVDLTLLKMRNFTLSALCVGIRMFLLRGIVFLAPLFVTDLYAFSATKTGILIAFHSGFLLLTMRLGGIIADRMAAKSPILVGLTLQTVSYTMLSILPESSSLAPVIVALALSGSGSGLSIAALHHTALLGVATENAGAGAGLYSMIRFIGSLFGAAVAGVVLEHGMGAFSSLATAYRGTFVVLAVIGALGIGLALLLRKHRGA